MGDVDSSGPGAVTQSGYVGKFDEVTAEVGRRAACVGMGWSVEAATAA